MSGKMQVACGADHTLAVTTDNQLLSFGDNSLQQLGRRTEEPPGIHTSPPEPSSWVVTHADGTNYPVSKVGPPTDFMLTGGNAVITPLTKSDLWPCSWTSPECIRLYVEDKYIAFSHLAVCLTAGLTELANVS